MMMFLQLLQHQKAETILFLLSQLRQDMVLLL
jgi:hypothetical protein